MRKLKLQIQISIDGFISGPKGEMQWMIWDWDEQLKNYVSQLTESIDCILLGRKLAQGFIPHWQSVASNPDNSEFDFAKKMIEIPKIVFTQTLQNSEWPNTAIAKTNIVDEVNKLKNQPGKDIIVYGGGAFVSSLIKEQLIDEFYLFVNPALLGTGMSIFNSVENKQELRLKESKSFDCGISLLCYTLLKE